MQPRTVTRFFPRNEAFLVHQTGAQLTATSKGVKVILHTREDESSPCCAELISGNHYAEIGLSFDGKELFDFDGAFYLPREIGAVLRTAGYLVSEEFFA